MWILFALMGAGLVANLVDGGNDEDDGTETRIGGGGGADALQDRAPDIIALSVIGTDEEGSRTSPTAPMPQIRLTSWEGMTWPLETAATT